jgi:hypothetical protein
MRFEIVFTPTQTTDKTLSDIIRGANLAVLAKDLPISIEAPRDDSPFFFYLFKPGEAFRHDPNLAGTETMYTRAELVLFELSALVIFLALATMLVPFAIPHRRTEFIQGAANLLFFAAIGFAFMCIEVSQLQRLMIFLGHPSYSLSVVLFTLLLSSGIGSWLTNVKGVQDEDKIDEKRTLKLAIACLCVLVVCLFAYGLYSPILLSQHAAATTPIRIRIAGASLFPLGLFMGTIMPLGLRLASARNPSLLPWFWGVNGATSVCASVLTVTIAITLGISMAYWLGTSFYFAALIFLLIANRHILQQPD